MPLDDLKALPKPAGPRHQRHRLVASKAKKAEKCGGTKRGVSKRGYGRPSRIHMSMAYKCGDKSARFVSYSKCWAPSLEAAAMRHYPPEVYEVLCEVKRLFWPVLNKESREATYNLCVATVYEHGEVIGEHSDTRHHPDVEVANVDGAAVFSASFGMSMELWTREFLSRTDQSDRMSRSQCKAADLRHGSAFCWDAGAEGSDDFHVKHSVWPHPEASVGEVRIALVFRAMKPEYAHEYTLKWPYRAVRPR